ncbi:MAG: AMP-binding protein, partial [Verrucomicrobiae bacterium]|nr:AMP-binding protein [Verrucomicrobiae bacterium]
QIIEDTPDQILKIISLDDLPEVEQLNRLKELTREDGQKPFDLAAEIPFRAKLYILSPEDHLLQITMHHIASDGWSSGIMLHELNSSYNACVNGQDPSLPPLNVQYADYTIWQRAWLQGEVLEKQLTYWKEQLSDLATLELPTDHPRPSISSNEGDRLSLLIPQFLVDKIQAIARRSGATLFMTLLAAFKVLMHRYSGQDDIAIGSPIAGRNERKLEDIIGFFVNTLVLRDDLSGNPKFTDLVKRVRNTALDAYDHPDIPFEKLVEELAPERDLSRNPLFQVMFILQNAPSTKLAFQDVEYTRFSVEKPSAKFDLKLAMTSEEAGLRAGWEFSTDLFDKETVQRMAEHYITLLESISANPEQTIGSLPMLSEPETYQQLEKWNNLEVYQGNQSMHALFEKQVADNPEMKAISCSGENLTYRELNEQANRLAHYLTSLEVTPATRVGVCLERSVDLVITLLGILKAGGVYVPLDPGYPSERLAYMLKDATAPVLITKEALRERVAEFEGRIVNLDSERDTIRSMDKNNPEISVSAASPAYVIYTSGSTGTPKGMELPHSTLVNLMVNGESETSGGRVAQFTSISFDVSLQEIFFALTSGSTLVVLDDEIRVKPEAFVRFLKEELITDLLVPDTVLQYVLQAVN